MRISDWSSDVCSSDLERPLQQRVGRLLARLFRGIGRFRLLQHVAMADAVVAAEQRENDQGLHHRLASPETNTWAERRFPPIGETDCRALADYRWGSAVAGSLPRASFPPSSFR